MIPPAQLWPSEGDRQQALPNGDRLSLPRLLLLDRGEVLYWHLPGNYSLPDAITWREQRPECPHAVQPGSATSGFPTSPLAIPGGLAGCRWLRWACMSLTTETLVADPQVPSCWREQRLHQRSYRGVNQLPAISYPNHGAAFGEGELLNMGLAHQYPNHSHCNCDNEESPRPFSLS